jgi:phosphoglycolate phosphatase
VLFDWDSTLANNWGAIHAAMNATLEALGREPWSLQTCRTGIKSSLRDSFPPLFGERAGAALETYLAAYERIHLAHLAAMPAAEAMLDAAAGLDLYLGIVSNKTGPNLRAEVAHLGWTSRFRKVVGAADAPRDKPAPDPVLLALGASGIAPGPDVWIVGDTDIDMMCAHNSGCTGILVNAERPSDDVTARPARHVPDCAGFARLLTTVCLSA